MDFATSLYEQASQIEQEGDLPIAEMIYRQLLADCPDHAKAARRLGGLLCKRGALPESLDWLTKSIRLEPHSAQAHLLLGQVLQGLGRITEATDALLLAACLQGRAINPLDAQGSFNLGMAFNRAGHPQAAAEAYRQAVRIRPDFAEAYNNLGISLQDVFQFDLAVAAHRQAVRLAPRLAGHHSNLAHALLAAGNLEEGFAEWQWRSVVPQRDFAQPAWDGASFAGKVLLAHAEQGYGDTLQFCRYLPEVSRLGGKLIVECRQPIAGLMRRLPGVAEVVIWGEALPPFDLQVPIPSLPHFCHTRRDNIPSPPAYLTPAPDRLPLWRDRVAGADGFKVGLVWAGNPRGADPRRAITLAAFDKLGRLPGVALFGLQRDAVETVPGDLPITHLGALVEDFDDLAAAVSAVDLLISVDTAAAHLAGGLGRPVWTLLHATPDWRWLLDETSTPWYPSMRLYRQRRPDDWGDLLDRVAADLGALVKRG